MLLLLRTTSVLKHGEVAPTVSSFSVSATNTAVSFASLLYLLLLLRRDMHFYFLVEVLLLLTIFLVGCADAAAGACAAYNINTEACLLYTSTYYCCKSFPVMLHDVMVGGWIASYVFIFIFWSRCCCCCCYVLLPTTSVLKRREVPPTVSSFCVSATTTAVFFASILLLLLLLRRDMHFCFLVEVLLLLIIFLVGCADAAAGACDAYNISTEAERYRLLFLPSASPLLLLMFPLRLFYCCCCC